MARRANKEAVKVQFFESEKSMLKDELRDLDKRPTKTNPLPLNNEKAMNILRDISDLTKEFLIKYPQCVGIHVHAQKPRFDYMTDEQLRLILPFLNKRCFKNPLTLEQLKEVFQYKRTHVQVKSVPVLACFFDALKEKGLLADGWQTTIQEKEMFFSKSGKPLNQRYISRASRNFKDNVKKHTLWKGYFEDIVINGEIEQLKAEL